MMKLSLKKALSLASLLSLSVITASQAQAANCSYSVINEWNTGFQGTVTITNNGTTAINGWTVGWAYTTNKITSSWNTTLSGSNPYSATALNWNATIQPGQSVSFGVQGDKNGTTAEKPTITGAVCSTVSSSSVASSTSSSKSSVVSASSTPSSTSSYSSKSSVVSSSSSSTSSACTTTSRCNWYGTLYPSCVTTPSGWGYENGKSCIATSTCSAQPAPFGVVAGCSISSSSAVSSSSSSKSSSSSSSVISSSSSVKSSSIASSSSSSVRSSTNSSNASTSSGPRLDNPFVGAVWYVDPIWSGKAMAETGGAKIAKYNTAVWMDRIGAIAPADGSFGLRDHLDAALAQNANLIQVVVYDLPNRDCHALSSNGELKQTAAGTIRYRTEYVDAIAAIFSDSKYKNLRIVAIIEPDSLPNLVTNLSDPDCAVASQGPDGYIPNTQYTLNKLSPITNVYSYVDIGHSGWLGWTENFSKAITLIGDVIKGTTHGVNSIAGFVSNTSGVTPLTEPFLDPFSMSPLPGNNSTQVRQAKFFGWNPQFSELSYVKAWRTAMIATGFPSTIGMLIDTGRNGWGGAGRPTALSTSPELETFVNNSRLDKRSHRGNWCNQKGGIGERPQAVNADGVDAYVWIKPPGESDGAASKELSYDPLDPSKGFDEMCSPTYTHVEDGVTVDTGAMPDAPVAGRWFPAGFKVLLDNAYPPLQ